MKAIQWQPSYSMLAEDG